MAPLAAEGKKTVCLNMIVRDESQIITRCLASVKPFIDYWVIVDTGSLDGTQQVIKDFMKDKPGELFERPWVNFEHNRNEALDLARTKGDYILIIDADDYLEAPPDFKFPQLSADAYQIQIKYGGMTYPRTQLFKSSLPWKWMGVVHEVIVCDTAHPPEMLEGVHFMVTRDGARAKDPKRYHKDAEILEEALKKDPTSTRYTFYLAQSYRDAGEKEKSLEWYQKRIAMGGWAEEVYISMLSVAKLQQALGMPVDTVIGSFERAHRYRPHRVEAVYHLAEMYNQNGMTDLAYALIKTREYIRQPATKDILFTEDWMEEYGVLFQLSIAAYWIERYQESLEACDKLLAMQNFPWKEQAQKNREFPIARLKDFAAKAA